MTQEDRQPEQQVDVGTRERILDVAEGLVQVRGFNGFSYADVARELGITRPALHYHFANKADLGRALVERYTARFAHALAEADGSTLDAAACLSTYAQLYVDVLRRGRMCLCGMLAAEYETLPAPVQQAVAAFFDRNEVWVASVLERGRHDHSLRFAGTPAEVARFVIGELEGAMLLARLRRDPRASSRPSNASWTGSVPLTSTRSRTRWRSGPTAGRGAGPRPRRPLRRAGARATMDRCRSPSNPSPE